MSAILETLEIEPENEIPEQIAPIASEEQEKPRRGRPPNSTRKGPPLGEEHEIPEQIAPISSEEQEKPRRGRPPNSTRKDLLSADGVTQETIDEKPKRTYTKKAKPNGFSAEAFNQLAKQIEGIHMLAGQLTGIPEFVLDAGDSQALALAVIGVCAQYDLAIDGKTGAALQLLGTAAIIYIPRYFAFRQRNAKDITNV